MTYSPPPTYCHNAYTHNRASVVKTVNFSNHNPVMVIPPEPEPGPPMSVRYAEPMVNSPPPGPSPPREHEVTKRKKSKRTRFAPEPNKHDNIQSGPVQHESHPNYHGPAQHEPNYKYHDPTHHEPGPSQQGPARSEAGQAYHGSVPIPYYAPSPLPKWEYGQGQGRQEYFSGEYRYYPTPIREGIYNIATDPHHLTTIFSEENPNACSIV